LAIPGTGRGHPSDEFGWSLNLPLTEHNLEMGSSTLPIIYGQLYQKITQRLSFRNLGEVMGRNSMVGFDHQRIAVARPYN
jgi:hypothetical protein